MSQSSGLLDSDNSLLLIVDMQTKLLNVMPEGAADDMVKNSQRLITAANLLNIPILITEQYSKGLGHTVESLTAELNDSPVVFEKTSFSCYSAENFSSTLQEMARKQIVIVGQEAHVCILQTALELMQHDYQIHIIEDAVCSRKAEHKFNALQRMQQQGATISNYESVLFEWIKDSRHEYFSVISRLLH
ncbi:hydrolase [Methyloprofundus sedimenti]|uniref:Hydrolase n=1 Tax=Methyloprofundus sedimenti TaxID=1420851 RepID=A0A1V8MA45_9GAMM|nr:isochorismatase family protein [Methyloprofundus sedimenti]OQK18388.1 hydrolase [Methyloprofundus sedimenti]